MSSNDFMDIIAHLLSMCVYHIRCVSLWRWHKIKISPRIYKFSDFLNSTVDFREYTAKRQEMNEWISTYSGRVLRDPNGGLGSDTTVYFKNKEDLLMFKLLWADMI